MKLSTIVTPINSLNCFMKFLSSSGNFPAKLELRDEGYVCGGVIVILSGRIVVRDVGDQKI